MFVLGLVGHQHLLHIQTFINLQPVPQSSFTEYNLSILEILDESYRIFKFPKEN